MTITVDIDDAAIQRICQHEAVMAFQSPERDGYGKTREHPGYDIARAELLAEIRKLDFRPTVLSVLTPEFIADAVRDVAGELLLKAMKDRAKEMKGAVIEALRLAE